MKQKYCREILSSPYIAGVAEVNYHCMKVATRHCVQCGYRCEDHLCPHMEDIPGKGRSPRSPASSVCSRALVVESLTAIPQNSHCAAR